MRRAELRAGQPLLFPESTGHCVSTRLGTLASPFKTTAALGLQGAAAFSGTAERNAMKPLA